MRMHICRELDGEQHAIEGVRDRSSSSGVKAKNGFRGIWGNILFANILESFQQIEKSKGNYVA